jgi:hypothetical protein
MPGTVTSKVEVVQLTPFGLWLAWGTEELFLDHDLFPWFRRAVVDQIFNVVEQGEGHFYWPDLDVDLDVDCIRHPERYPLVARGHGE